MKKILFKGAASAIPTPFTDNGINLEEFKKFLQFQIDNDIDALVVCGTTGESSTMTKDEKIEIIKCAVEVTHKNESSTRKIPVIAGTGSNNTKEAIEMSTKLDIIVLAGKGHEPYQEINGKKYPYDERIIVKEIIG